MTEKAPEVLCKPCTSCTSCTSCKLVLPSSGRLRARCAPPQGVGALACTAPARGRTGQCARGTKPIIANRSNQESRPHRLPNRGRSGSGFEPVGSILGRVLADLAARGDAERAGRRRRSLFEYKVR